MEAAPTRVAPESRRAHKMEHNRARALARASAHADKPGYFEARLTRAYAPDDHASGKGMSAANLRSATKSTNVPVWRQHKYVGAPSGQTVHAEFDPDDEFLYVSGVINVGDKGPGDALYDDFKNGRLKYVSAGFTIPPPDHPDPANFPSELLEVSFVDKPHDPHADVFCCHSRTDSDTKQHRLTLSGALLSHSPPVAMSSSSGKTSDAAATPATPAAAPTTEITPAMLQKQLLELAEQNRKLMERQKHMEEENKYFHEQRQKELAPRLEFVRKEIEDDPDINPDDRQFVTEFFSGAAADRRAQSAFNHHEKKTRELHAARAELAKLKEAQAAAQQTQNDFSRVFHESDAALRGGFSEANSPFTAGAPPLIAQHQAGAPKSAQLPPANGKSVADFIAACVTARRDEINERSSANKRTAV